MKRRRVAAGVTEGTARFPWTGKPDNLDNPASVVPAGCFHPRESFAWIDEPHILDTQASLPAYPDGRSMAFTILALPRKSILHPTQFKFGLVNRSPVKPAHSSCTGLFHQI
ncbi:MAG: hypothetical protein VX589_04080 [Myxococcota bacterium]|nr:hypothetical protein [Myxococcota bacterium]